MFMNVYVHGYVYVYDSICWALKCPVHCAEQFLELQICISPQFRAIDPPNPAGGFIQQNENVRFATAACMQKYGNVRFATVACAKCMRYGGRGGGDHTMGGGGWQHGTRNHIYVCIMYIYIYVNLCRYTNGHGTMPYPHLMKASNVQETSSSDHPGFTIVDGNQLWIHQPLQRRPEHPGHSGQVLQDQTFDQWPNDLGGVGSQRIQKEGEVVKW